MKTISQRARRVGESVREILAEILLMDSHHIPELEGKTITITQVIPNSDLRAAKVYVGALGGDEKTMAQLLNSFSWKLSSLVAKEIKTKHSPRLFFFPDDTHKKIKKIDDLLKYSSKS